MTMTTPPVATGIRCSACPGRTAQPSPRDPPPAASGSAFGNMNHRPKCHGRRRCSVWIDWTLLPSTSWLFPQIHAKAMPGYRYGPAPEWPWRCPLSGYSTPNRSSGGWARPTPRWITGCRLLALKGPSTCACQYLLIGHDQTCRGPALTAEFDPDRTLAAAARAPGHGLFHHLFGTSEERGGGFVWAHPKLK